MWKYSHHHINISDTDEVHCAMYGLGRICGHEYVGACELCTILTSLFDTPFESIINGIVLKQLNGD